MSKHQNRSRQYGQKSNQEINRFPQNTSNASSGYAPVGSGHRIVNRVWSIVLPIVIFLIFSLLAFIYLPIRNEDYLYACQEHSLWIDTQWFFDDCMRNVGGFTQWLGLYLTQYFYDPWLGSLFLVLIWGGIYFLTMQTFKLKGTLSIFALLPCVLLLCSELCLGYWVYYIKMPGYWFTYSIAILIMMLFLYVGTLLKGYFRAAYIVVYVFGLYPLIGCWSIYGGICLILIEGADFILSFIKKEKNVPSQTNKLSFHPTEANAEAPNQVAAPKRPIFSTILSSALTLVLGIGSLVAVPLFYYQQYSTLRKEEIWSTLFPSFEAGRYIETHNNWIFILLVIVLLIYAIGGRFGKMLMKKITTNASTKRRMTANMPWLTASVASIILFIFYGLLIHHYEYSDENFTAELRMYRCIETCDWKGALKESKQVKGRHTRQMILCQNIALFHLGKIGEEMFKYENRTVSPSVRSKEKANDIYERDMNELKKKAKEGIEKENEKRKKEGLELVKITEDTLKSCVKAEIKALNGNIHRDSLKVSLVNVAGPLIYFNYGKCNFAYRWCVENGVEFGFRVDEYKMMVHCAMMSGEDHLAAKYLDILHHTTFHREWAEKRLAMLKDKKKYQASEEFKCISPLYQTFNNALDGDQGIIELYLNNYFSHMYTKDPKFQDAGLAFALIQKDIPLFWNSFNAYASLHENEEMPTLYQQAAYLFGNLEPQTFKKLYNRDFSTQTMPFDKATVVDRYNKFMEKTQGLLKQYSANHDQAWLKKHDADITRKVGEACYKEYGDTYYWFYYFSRGVHTY